MKFWPFWLVVTASAVWTAKAITTKLIAVEFLPFTQKTGGFEQLGLWVCQGNAHDSAATLRQMMGEEQPDHEEERGGA